MHQSRYSSEGYLENTHISGGDQGEGFAFRTSDLLGRTIRYEEIKNGSSTLVRSTVYDDDGRQKLQTGSEGTVTYFYYGASNADGTDNTATATQNGAGLQARVQVVSGTTTTNTWTYYSYWDEAKQQYITLSAWSADKTINNADWKSGLSYFEYDSNGHLKSARDFGSDPAPANTADDRTFTYLNNAQGMVLQRDMVYRDPKSGSTAYGNHRYIYANGATVGDIGNDGDVRLDYAQTLVTLPRNRESMYKSWMPISSADFDQNYLPINRDYPGPVSSSYVAKLGDTLYSIAAAVWGDSSMWYLIADANGLTADADIASGQVIRIPNKVTNIHNNSSTMRPYSAGERMGDTSPTLPDAPVAPIPTPKQNKKCGGLAKIIVAVVAVVATIYTAGLASGALGAGFGATMSAGATALQGGSLFAATIGGAVGNAAGQLAGMALGTQDKFNWGGVATGALTGLATAGVASLNVGGSLTSAMNLTGATATYIGAATNAAVGNMATQGMNILAGQQKNFSWSSVAASAIASPMVKYADEQLFRNGGALAGTWAARNDLPGQFAQTGVSAVVSAASRIVVSRGHVSWTDIAADTISSVAVRRLSGESRPTSEPESFDSGFNNSRMQKAIDLAFAAEDRRNLALAEMPHYSVDLEGLRANENMNVDVRDISVPDLPPLSLTSVMNGAISNDSIAEISESWSSHRQYPFGYNGTYDQPLGALGRTANGRMSPEQALIYDREQYYGWAVQKLGLPHGLGVALAPGKAAHQSVEVIGGIAETITNAISAVSDFARTSVGLYFNEEGSYKEAFERSSKLRSNLSGVTLIGAAKGAAKGLTQSSYGLLAAAGDKNYREAGRVVGGSLLAAGAGTVFRSPLSFRTASSLMFPAEAKIAFASSRGLHVDLFGGQQSPFKGVVNVDINALNGVKADLTKGLGFLPDGSVSNMTAFNPFIPGRNNKFSSDIIGEAGRVLEPGGEFIIAATKGNGYVKFDKFPTPDELSLAGFDVVQHKVKLTELDNYADRFGQVAFSKSGGSGTIFHEDMITIVLRKR